jgi:hypothetical protein
MRTNHRPLQFLSLALVLAAGAVAPATAQDCCDDWDEPFICHLEVTHGADASRPGDDVDVVELRSGEKADLRITAFDQRGRVYPGDEIRYNVVDAGDCGRLVSWDAVSSQVLRVHARGRDGSCELTLRVPGNRNLDQRLQIYVDRRAPSEPAGAESEAHEVAERLYLAVLGREADARGLADAVAAIRAGRTEAVVSDMFRSREFAEKRSNLDARQLLDSLYRGLLGRPSDDVAERTFLARLVRNQRVDVVMGILASDEFRDDVARAVD